MNEKTEKGLRDGLKADFKSAEADEAAAYGDNTAGMQKREAEALQREAEANLKPTAFVRRGTGGEIVSAETHADVPGIVDTVENPTLTTLEASRDRLELASKAGALALAADTAETIQPQNALEKMLAHQLAVAHKLALETAANSSERARAADDCVEGSSVHKMLTEESAKLANASARLMRAFSDGLLALHKIRHGGQQTVTVQHVTVGDGGQAVVAGRVDRGKSDENGG